MSKIHRGDIAGESGLPPQEYWLIDPAREKIETPVDDRGLIKVDELITCVKRTIDPDYIWPRHLSGHHIYWEKEWYEGREARTFRELSVHKILVPRVFENWLHKATIAPRVPDEQTMRERVLAWTLARNLFEHARDVVVWERRGKRREELLMVKPWILPPAFRGEDKIGKEYIQQQTQRHFDGFLQGLEKYEQVPREVRLVEQPSQNPAEAARQLGVFTTKRALPMIGAVLAA